MYAYLSPEWRDAAQPIRDRFAARSTGTVPLVGNVTVTGMPFGASTAEMHSPLGVPNVFDPGHVAEADVALTMDYHLARLILLDMSTNLLQLGFDSGQIAVTGDVDRLRSYWREHIGDEVYLTMMDELRAITK
jgi:hypothetical protein